MFRRVFGLLTIMLAGALMLPSQSHAEQPVRLDGRGQVTDLAGALDDEATVEGRLAEARDSSDAQVFVVYVRSFDALDAREWADRTAEQNGLGLNDMLLAVAVDDRQYAYSVPDRFPLSDAQLERVAAEDVEPALSRGDWAGAAVGAAEGVQRESTGGAGGAAGGADAGLVSTAGIVAVVGCLGVLLVALVGSVIVGARRISRTREPAASPAGRPAAQVAIEDLSARAGALLVEMDDALETSDQDVGFAEAEFGTEAAAPFRQAVERARADVAEAFRLQQRLSDSVPDTDEERRAILVEIISRCERADNELESHAARFEELRDRTRRSPQIADAVEATLQKVRAWVPDAEAVLQQLSDAYPPSAFSAVADNARKARERLEFATDALTKARNALRANDNHRAATLLSAAEEAVAQASRLLDAVHAASTELAMARGSLEEVMDDVRRDIASGEAVVARDTHAVSLVGALAGAQAALGEAEAALAGGRFDPLATLRRLESADVPLEDALGEYSERAEKEQRARTRLDDLIGSTRSRIAAVHDFVSTNRGGIGPEARAALAEAQARLTQASSLRKTDVDGALAAAEQAAQYAERALQAAQRDLSSFSQEAYPSRGAGPFGGDIGSMVLGGILLGQMFGGRGGFGGWGGGWGGGGLGGGRRGGFGRFSPGSFGGMASRRGGGGRF